jgi:hypothetical protein
MSSELAERVATTPMEMIQVAFDAAIKQGSAMEVVNAILEQQKWMIQHGEEEAFNAALKRIQKRLKAIPKHGVNKETHSKFATSADIDREIQVLLDDENMTLSFRPGISDKIDMVLVTGMLSLGAFTKEYPLEMPADGKGAKGGGVMSRTHATGAAITYAKRLLKNMILDLRFEEKDDDGNSASGVKIPSEKVGEWLKAISEETNLKELMKLWGKVYTTTGEMGDMNARDILIPAYEARKAELQGAA